MEMWFVNTVRGTLGEIGAAVPIVISCTSIPTEFSSISGVTPVPFSNRTLLENVRRGTNRPNLVYGDWGSTRPRAPSGFANRPLDRVDYPGVDGWNFARNKEREWTFRDAARAIVSEPGIWDGNLISGVKR